MRVGFMIEWTPSDNRNYPITKGYKRLMGAKDKHDMANITWARYNIPKHACYFWRTSLQRLATCDRLNKQAAIQLDPICYLCHDVEETQEYIFFECAFNQNWYRMPS